MVKKQIKKTKWQIIREATQKIRKQAPIYAEKIQKQTPKYLRKVQTGARKIQRSAGKIQSYGGGFDFDILGSETKRKSGFSFEPNLPDLIGTSKRKRKRGSLDLI